MNHWISPIYDELLHFIKKTSGNFFVPGHKCGAAFDLQGSAFFSHILQLDATEVSTLDDLHKPEGVIRDAQNLAADAYSADSTFFLVNGTTSGILASILSVGKPGDTLIVERTCHQSVFNGCILAGVKVVVLPSGFCVKQLGSCLDRYHYAKGVLVTNPAYDGALLPLQELVRVCHLKEIPLIVDEAHGAHLGFHSRLPMSAMQCGADVSIQSTHKMSTSMTMSSMLHVKGNRICKNELTRWLKVLQSSSPSYPLMASLDLARRFMMQRGKERLERSLGLLDSFREKMRKLHFLIEIKRGDPFKFSLTTRVHRVSGYVLLQKLEGKGIYAEFADDEKVLLVFSMGTSKEELNNLWKSLQEIDGQIPHLDQTLTKVTEDYLHQEVQEIDLSAHQEGRGEYIALDNVVGRTAFEGVVPYPPGVPLLIPGEKITKTKQECLRAFIQKGHRIHGLHNHSSSPCICVLQ